MTDTEQAIADCWQCIADAAVEGDADHERRALAALALLVQRHP